MSRFDQAMTEISSLKTQIKSDFQFTAMAMQEMSEHSRQNFQAMAHRMNTLGGEMSERFHQVEGRVRLLDQRFGQMLQAVESSLTELREDSVPMARFQELEVRVDRIERTRPPAA